MFLNREIYDLNLPHRAVAVYMYLCDRADQNGTSFPSHKTIANDLHLSVSTVKRALQDLEQAQQIKKSARFQVKNGRTSNYYHVLNLLKN